MRLYGPPVRAHGKLHKPWHSARACARVAPILGVRMAGKIFINYRRSLNLVEAQLLKKVLQRHFGKAGVFLDVSGLEGGQHWLHALEAQVDAAAA